MDSLLARSKRGEAIDTQLQDLAKLVASEHSQVIGTIEYLLKPAKNHDEDLNAVLIALAESLSRHWQVAVELVGQTGTILLSADLANELKAIFREAVSNAVRHGQANKISLDLEAMQDELKLTIVNDGKEFEPSNSTPKTIDSRVRNLKGRLDIVSRTGETRISIAIPLGAQ